MNKDQDRIIAQRGRTTALVIAAAGIVGLLAPVLGLPVQYEILIYLVALAAFIWAFVNIYQIWRMRQNSQR